MVHAAPDSPESELLGMPLGQASAELRAVNPRDATIHGRGLPGAPPANLKHLRHLYLKVSEVL